MVLNYKIVSDQEDKMRNILENGEYNFKVKQIRETKTKNGNHDMLAVILSINKNGREFEVRDWIVLMDSMAFKLRHFSSTCNLLDKYNDKKLDANDFIGRTGKVKLGLRDFRNSNDELIKVNSVIDYIENKVNNNSSVDNSEDVPF